MQSQDARIIVGLGNPGERYANTRHNVGFMVVEKLAHQEGCRNWSREAAVQACRCHIGGHEVVVAEPLTYMNNSGRAVQSLLDLYGAQPDRLLLVLDDLSLPFGKIRVRERGSSGGHKGIESIMQALNTDEVLRIRLGVGEENMPEEKADFVLSQIPRTRQEELDRMIALACDAVRCILDEGSSKAMSVFNATQ